jgi:hypothetical protein
MQHGDCCCYPYRGRPVPCATCCCQCMYVLRADIVPALLASIRCNQHGGAHAAVAQPLVWQQTPLPRSARTAVTASCYWLQLALEPQLAAASLAIHASVKQRGRYSPERIGANLRRESPSLQPSNRFMTCASLRVHQGAGTRGSMLVNIMPANLHLPRRGGCQLRHLTRIQKDEIEAVCSHQ